MSLLLAAFHYRTAMISCLIRPVRSGKGSADFVTCELSKFNKYSRSANQDMIGLNCESYM